MKLGAGKDGSGLLLANDANEPGVHILAKDSGSSLPPQSTRAAMATYEYALLIGRDAAGGAGGVTWYVNGIGNPLGTELPAILNGWAPRGGASSGSATRVSTSAPRSS